MSKKKYNNRNFSNVESVEAINPVESNETTEYRNEHVEDKCICEAPEVSESETIADEVIAEVDPSYAVKVDIDTLNIRKGPGMNYDKTGKYTGRGIFTIVETCDGEGSKIGWGRLKTGCGWICLDFTERV